jgi:hypothetical protein
VVVSDCRGIDQGSGAMETCDAVLGGGGKRGEEEVAGRRAREGKGEALGFSGGR